MTGLGVSWYGNGACGCPNRLEHMARCRGDSGLSAADTDDILWVGVDRDDDGEFKRFVRRSVRSLDP